MKKKQALYLFGLFMMIVYCGMGVLFIYSTTSEQILSEYPKVIRIIFGILLFIYGIFRAYRLIKSRQYEEEDN
jgi:predicted transporter